LIGKKRRSVFGLKEVVLKKAHGNKGMGVSKISILSKALQTSQQTNKAQEE